MAILLHGVLLLGVNVAIHQAHQNIFRQPFSYSSLTVRLIPDDEEVVHNPKVILGNPLRRSADVDEKIRAEARILFALPKNNTVVDLQSTALPAIDKPLDMDQLRIQARQIARENEVAGSRIRSGSALPILSSSNSESETGLGRAIKKSARPDCRAAYADAGLMAIPLLLRDAVTDRGCRW